MLRGCRTSAITTNKHKSGFFNQFKKFFHFCISKITLLPLLENLIGSSLKPNFFLIAVFLFVGVINRRKPPPPAPTIFPPQAPAFLAFLYISSISVLLAAGLSSFFNSQYSSNNSPNRFGSLKFIYPFFARALFLSKIFFFSFTPESILLASLVLPV